LADAQQFAIGRATTPRCPPRENTANSALFLKILPVTGGVCPKNSGESRGPAGPRPDAPSAGILVPLVPLVPLGASFSPAKTYIIKHFSFSYSQKVLSTLPRVPKNVHREEKQWAKGCQGYQPYQTVTLRTIL
jgi:hypothetical protein